MGGFALDTSCMVAAVCTWHEHHGRALSEINERLAARQPMIVAAPALVEAYAVLTRLPPPHRLSPANALALVDANFIRVGKVVALDARSYAALLREIATNEIAGGRAYDAVIARCVAKAQVRALLTFNAPHFVALVPAGIEVVVPGGAGQV